MSCHTWTYKKVRALTLEEKQKILNKEIESLSGWWGFKKTAEEVIEQVKRWYKRLPQLYDNKISPEEYALDLIDEYTKKRDSIIYGGFDAFLKDNENSYPKCFKYNNEYYVNICCDEPFRLFKFPNFTGFISGKENVLNYLKTVNPEVIAYYIDKEPFIVRGYSDELVRRIEKFFDTYGEENIMFDFG